jgi:SNF2 family DNA or RNA helicase
MGLGKTLTALSVMWAFARKGTCKSLIICPSSLVDNWVKETKHWLGTKVKPLVMKPGGDAKYLINTFRISLISMYPVMIVSYEVIAWLPVSPSVVAFFITVIVVYLM